MENSKQNTIVEALILASPEPIAARRISEAGSGLTPGKVTQAVAELNRGYEKIESSFRIREVAGGYQFYILPDFSKFVDAIFTRRRKLRLTRAAMETLAIIAYRQPVTKVDIEHVRGVSSDGVLHNLLEKKLVNIKGRAESAGRALQYGTTDEFLKFFGINALEDLPQMSEIEEILKSSGDEEIDELNVESAVTENSATMITDETTNGNIHETNTPEPEIKEQKEPETASEITGEEVNRVSGALKEEETDS
jgi:segregation and condensation protein B